MPMKEADMKRTHDYQKEIVHAHKKLKTLHSKMSKMHEKHEKSYKDMGSSYKGMAKKKVKNPTIPATKSKQKEARKAYQKVAKTSKPGTGKRFAALSTSLKAQGVKDPGALAASIGRKKYGAKRFAKMGSSGRKRKVTPMSRPAFY